MDGSPVPATDPHGIATWMEQLARQGKRVTLEADQALALAFERALLVAARKELAEELFAFRRDAEEE